MRWLLSFPFYSLLFALQDPKIETLMALFILSLRESEVGHLIEAGNYCWNICRIVWELDLHRRETTDKSTMHQIDKRHCINLYWCTYTLDKILAARLGRPCILRSSESDCSLPAIIYEEKEWAAFQFQQHSILSSDERIALLHRGCQITASSYFNNMCQLAEICEIILAQVRERQRQREMLNIRLAAIDHLLTTFLLMVVDFLSTMRVATTKGLHRWIQSSIAIINCQGGCKTRQPI